MSADLAPNNSILFIPLNYIEVECELGFVGAIVNDPISLILCKSLQDSRCRTCLSLSYNTSL